MGRNDLALYNRGLCHYEFKNYFLSIKDFDEAIKINPKHNPSYYYSRGLSNLKLHNFEDGL
jgi:tetratricopeptide (TPR) repeat protein